MFNFLSFLMSLVQSISRYFAKFFKFHLKSTQWGAELFYNGRTDISKPVVAFRNSANALEDTSYSMCSRTHFPEFTEPEGS
jgi:hypothetical protein